MRHSTPPQQWASTRSSSGDFTHLLIRFSVSLYSPITLASSISKLEGLFLRYYFICITLGKEKDVTDGEIVYRRCE
jgi:hypothetical protein